MKKRNIFLLCAILFVSISSVVIGTVSYYKTDGKSLESRQHIIRKYYKNAQSFSVCILGKNYDYAADVFLVDDKTGLALFKEGDLGRFELIEIETTSEEGVVVMEVFVDNKYYYIGTIDRNRKKATVELKCDTPGACCVKRDVLAYDCFVLEKPSEPHEFSVNFE